MHGVSNIKFAHIFKFSKKVQKLQRTSCIQRRNRTKLETFEHLTVGDVRRTCSGKLRHPPYSFSFKYALKAIGSTV